MVIIEESILVHHIKTMVMEVGVAFVTNWLQMMIAQRRHMLQSKVNHLN